MTVLDSPPRSLDELGGTLVCTAVEPVTHDVTTFHLATPGDRTLAFRPGQYVTVTVEVGGAPLTRCYSITSPATAASGLAVTVKRVPGGPVSNWLHDHLAPGGRLEVAGPFGTFGSGRVPGRPELFLTAGSGLTPLMCMARTLVESRDADGAGADVVLVHHARTPADVIFRDELERLHDLHPGIRVEVVCEEAGGDQAWRGHRGRISQEHLAEVVPDLASRDVLVCGPPPYRQVAREIVLALGAAAGRVHEESYDVGPAGPSTGSGVTHTVEFRRSGRTVTCDESTAILVAASEAGITHPSSCRSGMCGTCKTTLLTGSVAMDHAGGIRPREIADRKILLCCSTPTSDVVLDA